MSKTYVVESRVDIQEFAALVKYFYQINGVVPTKSKIISDSLSLLVQILRKSNAFPEIMSVQDSIAYLEQIGFNPRGNKARRAAFLEMQAETIAREIDLANINIKDELQKKNTPMQETDLIKNILKLTNTKNVQKPIITPTSGIAGPIPFGSVDVIKKDDNEQT